MAGEIRRMVRQDDVFPVAYGEAFGTHGGGDDGFAHGHGFVNFDAGAAAAAQGNDADGGFGEIGAYVVHSAGYMYVRGRQSPRARGGAAAYRPKRSSGDFALDERKDFVDIVGHAIFVGHPVHAAGEDGGFGFLGKRGWLEVFGIHTGRDHGDAVRLDISEEESAIVFRDGQHMIG